MDDLDEQMMNAFMEDLAPAKVPRSDQERFLRANIDSLSIENKKAIGGVLETAGLRDLMNRQADGTAIDMGAMPDDLILHMYELMTYMLLRK